VLFVSISQIISHHPTRQCIRSFDLTFEKYQVGGSRSKRVAAGSWGYGYEYGTTAAVATPDAYAADTAAGTVTRLCDVCA